jgi:hypothetical protein
MRGRFAPAAWLVATTTLVGLVGPAWAQEDLEAAAQLFRSGKAAYERGEYAAAARSFELAYGKAPRTPAIFAAAVAWEAADDKARAAAGFKLAVHAGDLPAADAGRAKERLAALSAQLAQLRVDAEPGAKVLVGSLSLSNASAGMFLDPGRHVVVIERPDGTTFTRIVELGTGSTTEIEAHDAGVEPVETTKVAPPLRNTEGGGMARSTERTFAWVALGGAAVALGATAYLGSQAVSARDTWEENPSMANLDERDRAASLRGWTNVSLAATAVLGTVGVVLFLSSAPDGREAESASVAVTPKGGSLSLRF